MRHFTFFLPCWIYKFETFMDYRNNTISKSKKNFWYLEFEFLGSICNIWDLEDYPEDLNQKISSKGYCPEGYHQKEFPKGRGFERLPKQNLWQSLWSPTNKIKIKFQLKPEKNLCSIFVGNSLVVFTYLRLWDLPKQN